MSISKMTLLEFSFPKSQIEKFLQCAQEVGTLQLEEVPLVVHGVRSYLHRLQLTEEEESEIRKFHEVRGIVSDMEPLFKGMSPSDEQLYQFRSKLPSEKAELLHMRMTRLRRKGDSLWRKRTNVGNDMQTLQNYSKRLEQLQELHEEFNFSESMQYMGLLHMPDDASRVRQLDSRLSIRTQDNYKLIRSDKPKSANSDEADILVLAFPEEYRDEIRKLVSQSGLVELRLPKQAQDLPLFEAVPLLQSRLEELPGLLAGIEAQIAEFKAENIDALMVTKAICDERLARLEARKHLAHSDQLGVAHAWIPTEAIPEFTDLLHKEIGETVASGELPMDDVQPNQIPVKLKNAQMFKPFEGLLKLFSDPLYGNFDPTPIMAVVFPIFFGLILGDAAYGLCIIGLAIWARKKWGSSEMAKDISTVAIWCGLSSVMFGVIFGEFLGDLLGSHQLNVLPIKIGDFRIMPIWDERKNKINELLMLTIIIGFVHILFGLLLGIVEAIRLRDKHHLGERLGLLLGLLGMTTLAGAVAMGGSEGIGTILFPVGGVLLVVAVGLLLVFAGPTGPIEIISLIANVLSYSRLMALGVAGMVIAELANELAVTVDSIFLRLVIAIPIHALALGLGMLEPTIHALRLHFVEFLPKFFTGDGRAYQPLTKRGMN